MRKKKWEKIKPDRNRDKGQKNMKEKRDIIDKIMK